MIFDRFNGVTFKEEFHYFFSFLQIEQSIRAFFRFFNFRSKFPSVFSQVLTTSKFIFRLYRYITLRKIQLLKDNLLNLMIVGVLDFENLELVKLHII